MGEILDEEKKLVEDILRGKPGAAKLMYKRYHRAMKLYVRARTMCVEDAEEIVQDVFLSGIESLGIFAGRSKLITWLYGIARHEISDYYRKKRVKTMVMSHVDFLAEILGDGSWEEKFDRLALRDEVARVMNGLLPRYAEVLRMKYLEGWSVQDMAEELNESFKATETALFRARKAFAVEWVKHNGNQ